MATNTAQLSRAPLLPPGASQFLRRRLAELGGVALVALGAILSAACLSYSPVDPSFNTAGGTAEGGSVGNVIGVPGAYGADLLLQTFGAATAVVVALLAAWGWALLSHRGLSRVWLRVGLAPCALILAAFGCAAIGASAWPTAAGPGGVMGAMIADALMPLVPGGGIGSVALTAGVLALALGSLVVALGLPAREWRALFRVARGLIARAGRAAVSGLHWVRAQTEPRFADDEAEDEAGVEEAAPRRRTRLEPNLIEAERAAAGRQEPRLRDVPEPPHVVEPMPPRAKAGKRAVRERQPALDLEGHEEYTLPPLALLKEAKHPARGGNASAQALQQNAEMLLSVLEDFGVLGEIVRIRPGPVVTLYELVPQPGTRTSRVIGLSDDIARSMSAISVRAATIPGRNVIGIELPNSARETVFLRELLSSATYESTALKLTLALGKDISGAAVTADLSRMPHLLIAGTTGSGKSVALNSMILSLLYRLPPDQCKLIMIDPKMLELSVYDDIPHLLTPVVTDPSKAVVALKWTVREMESRYQAMSKLGVRNITGYNKRLAEARANGERLTRRVQTGLDPDTGEPIQEEQELDLNAMPFIVVVVDEMADLMLVAGKDIEGAVQRLAQMARAAGIHLIMATQRPSVDVITGTIKANFPTRISFQVTSKIDSRTILGEAGAEQLLGQGDMLYLEGAGRLTRVHGPFVSDSEVERVTDFLRAQGRPDYVAGVTDEPESVAAGLGEAAAEDPLYDQAVALVARERKASTSFVQRHLQIGYNRAARIIERMEAEGVVGQANHVGKREVLVSDHSGDG